jgi:hypothetical protein
MKVSFAFRLGNQKTDSGKPPTDAAQNQDTRQTPCLGYCTSVQDCGFNQENGEPEFPGTETRDDSEKTILAQHKISGLRSVSEDRKPGPQARRKCCYNPVMTLVEVTYDLPGPLRPEQLRALGQFANIYGLRRFRVDEQLNRLSFEYDASRLKETEVAHVLRMARIPVERRV